MLVSGDPTALEGTPYAITLGQPNVADVTAYTINWGDGQVQTIAAADLPASRQVEHLYADGPDEHTIAVQATNASGTYGDVPVAAYLFDGGFDDSSGAPALTPIGTGQFITDTVFGQTRSVYRFDLRSGFSLSTAGLLSRTEYTIEMVFRFDDVIGWQKFLDLDNRTIDEGMYVDNGKVEYYPHPPAGSFPADEYQHVVITRSAATNQVRIYVNGTEISSFTDSTFIADIGTAEILHFLLDDNLTGGGETSAGRVAMIRLYNTALAADHVAALDFNTVNVAVANVAPVVSAAAAQQAVVNVGETFDLGSFADPGADAPWAVSVNWGDLSSSAFSVAGPGALNAPHTYADVGDYQVTVTVTDKDGASHSASFTVTVVANTPPSNVAIDVIASPVSEGDSATLTVSFDDPDADQGHALVIDFGDGHSETVQLGAGVFSYTTTHTYADNGTFSIQATVTDPFNESAGASVDLGVDNNINPVYTAAPDQTGRPTSFDLGSFTDAGLLDGPWTVTVSWGDGSKESFNVSEQGALSCVHDYSKNGKYTVTVTITDKDGGVASGSFQVHLKGKATGSAIEAASASSGPGKSGAQIDWNSLAAHVFGGKK